MPSLSIPTALATGSEAATVGAASLVPSAATVATVASLGGTAISALGTLGQSRANAAAAGYNAKIAAQNAQIQTQNANFTAAQGEQNVGAAGAKTRADVAAITANEGASGIDVNTGSPVSVRESEAKLGMLNALNIRSQAARQAYGYETGAIQQTAQSTLDRKQQTYDTEGGYLNAGATVLGGVGTAAKYVNYLNSTGI